MFFQHQYHEILLSKLINQTLFLKKLNEQNNLTKNKHTMQFLTKQKMKKKIYHNVFGAHLTTNKYYQKNFVIIIKKNFNYIKLHKNNLFFELKHFDNFKKYSHDNDFKQIMKTKIKTLKSKTI